MDDNKIEIEAGQGWHGIKGVSVCVVTHAQYGNVDYTEITPEGYWIADSQSEVRFRENWTMLPEAQ